MLTPLLGSVQWLRNKQSSWPSPTLLCKARVSWSHGGEVWIGGQSHPCTGVAGKYLTVDPRGRLSYLPGRAVHGAFTGRVYTGW